MRITASVRPSGLKRGTTDKKLCKLLGLKETVGLSHICGRLELNATRPVEFEILHAIYEVVMGGEWGGGGRISIVNKDGKRTRWFVPTKKELEKDKVPA